jgi:hypothetical protein
VRECAVVALDGEDGIPFLDEIAFVERVDRQGAPVFDADLENRDGLVDSGKPAALLRGDLHDHARRFFRATQDIGREQHRPLGKLTCPDSLRG